jgi:hypothetical protein
MPLSRTVTAPERCSSWRRLSATSNSCCLTHKINDPADSCDNTRVGCSSFEGVLSCLSGPSGGRERSLFRSSSVDVRTIEEVFEATDAIPPISIGLEQEAVLATSVRLAMIFG